MVVAGSDLEALLPQHSKCWHYLTELLHLASFLCLCWGLCLSAVPVEARESIGLLLLELQLHIAESCNIISGNQTQVLCRSSANS